MPKTPGLSIKCIAKCVASGPKDGRVQNEKLRGQWGIIERAQLPYSPRVPLGYREMHLTNAINPQIDPLRLWCPYSRSMCPYVCVFGDIVDVLLPRAVGPLLAPHERRERRSRRLCKQRAEDLNNRDLSRPQPSVCFRWKR